MPEFARVHLRSHRIESSCRRVTLPRLHRVKRRISRRRIDTPTTGGTRWIVLPRRSLRTPQLWPSAGIFRHRGRHPGNWHRDVGRDVHRIPHRARTPITGRRSGSRCRYVDVRCRSNRRRCNWYKGSVPSSNASLGQCARLPPSRTGRQLPRPSSTASSPLN
jgi:hypothetical protein